MAPPRLGPRNAKGAINHYWNGRVAVAARQFMAMRESSGRFPQPLNRFLSQQNSFGAKQLRHDRSCFSGLHSRKT